MRIILKKYRVILLSVCLLAGVSITGWALAFHYDNKAKSAESQKEMKNENQKANPMPSARDHNTLILVLLCTGLVGFFGVRRHRKALENVANTEPPGMLIPHKLLKRR